MKKLLLSCSLALGLSANAQTTFFTEDFESAITWSVVNFGTAPAYPRNGFTIVDATSCPVNSITGKSMSIIGFTSASTFGCGYVATPTANASFKPLVRKQIDASQYASLLLSYNWKGYGDLFNGTLYDYGELMYSTDPAGLAGWTLIGSRLGSGNVNTQTVTDLALPADLNHKAFWIGWRFTSDNVDQLQPGLSIDDIVIKGTQITTAPACTTFTAPINNGTANAGTFDFKWTAVTGAQTYKLKIGTITGGSDIYNQTITTTSVSVPLNKNTTYYATVVPSNNLGDATGCSEITFTTNSNVGYCSTGSSTPDHQNFGNISNVVFADISNSSVGNNNAYKDFTAVTGNVLNGSSNTITVTHANYNANNQNRVAVWIDYNRDGVFSASEQTLLTTTGTTAPGTSTGTINIPEDVDFGTTRMRVRLNLLNVVPPACGVTAYGQTEDYTINIKDKTLAVSDISKTGISVYPNPFTDVLKISDVKGVKSVSVNDISGREVKSHAPSAEINLSSLKAGLYIVNLKMEDGSVKTFKAIKK